MLKKTGIFLLFVSCFSLGFAANSSVSEAVKQDSVIKDTMKLTPVQEKEISFFTKRTSMSGDEVKELLSRGFSRDKIKEIYVFFALSNEKLDNVVSIYDEEGDLQLTMKDLNITPKRFQEKMDATFPEGDDDDFGLVLKNKAPWKKPVTTW